MIHGMTWWAWAISAGAVGYTVGLVTGAYLILAPMRRAERRRRS